MCKACVIIEMIVSCLFLLLSIRLYRQMIDDDDLFFSNVAYDGCCVVLLLASFCGPEELWHEPPMNGHIRDFIEFKHE